MGYNIDIKNEILDIYLNTLNNYNVERYRIELNGAELNDSELFSNTDGNILFISNYFVFYNKEATPETLIGFRYFNGIVARSFNSGSIAVNQTLIVTEPLVFNKISALITGNETYCNFLGFKIYNND